MIKTGGKVTITLNGHHVDFTVHDIEPNERRLSNKKEEKETKSDRDLIVELSQTVAKLKRRIDVLEERAEMNEEDIEKWGSRTVEADYKAGQALINTKLTKEGVDRE